MINVWVPNETPINTRPASYMFTAPINSGWKQIQVSRSQFDKWQTNTIENYKTSKNILLG